METDKKLMCAITMCVIIYMVFVYNQVHSLKLSVQKDHDTMTKRLTDSEKSHNELCLRYDKVSNELLSRHSDETE